MIRPSRERFHDPNRRRLEKKCEIQREREREREKIEKIFFIKEKGRGLWVVLSTPNAKITHFFIVISPEFQITKLAKKAQISLA